MEEQPVNKFLKNLQGHRQNVIRAGRKLGVDELQLQQHDLSKFSEIECVPYAEKFFGDGTNDQAEWSMAWLHHIHNNPHHWQHWMFPDGWTPRKSGVEDGLVEMPEKYALEMIADWMGASMSYTGGWDMTAWLERNLPKIKLHSETARFVGQVLVDQGYASLVFLFLGFDDLEVECKTWTR